MTKIAALPFLIVTRAAVTAPTPLAGVLPKHRFGKTVFKQIAQLLGQLPPTVGDPKRDREIAALYRRSLQEIN